LEKQKQSNSGDSAQLNENQQKEVIEKLMGLVVLAGAEIESLRLQNQEFVFRKSDEAKKEEEAAIRRLQQNQARLDEALQNQTSLEVRMEEKPPTSNFREVESYESLPESNHRSSPSEEAAVSSDPPASDYRPPSSSNFDKKDNIPSSQSGSNIGSKRSIKMIKMAAKPSIEIDSPLVRSRESK
jgi:hypothetical protein